MAYIGYIYKYTSPSSKVYIGQTRKSIKSRAGKEGLHYQFHDTPFSRAIKKYGWNDFELEILETVRCETISDLVKKLNNLEERHILANNSMNADFGYNCKTSGKSHLVSPETRKKISESKKGKPLTDTWKKNISLSMTGKITKKPDAITRKKMSLAKKGISLTIPHRKKIGLSITGNNNAYKHIDKNKLESLRREGLTWKEISTIMGISISTIKNRRKSWQKV